MKNKVAATGVAVWRNRCGLGLLLALGLILAPLSSGGAQEFDDIDPAELDALFEQGHQSLTAGQYASSAESFAEILKLDPSDGEARVYLARALRAQGEYDRAEAELRRVLAEQADEVAEATKSTSQEAVSEIRHTPYDLAELLGVRGQYEDGIALVDKILAVNPGDYRAGTIRGLLLESSGKRDEAQAEFVRMHRRARRSYPRGFEQLLYLGIGMRHVRGYSDADQLAKQLYDEAKEIEPLNQRLFTERGGLYLEKYQSGDAINYEFRPALAQNPNLTAALVGLADAYIYRFELYKARQEIERALKINPRHPTALLRRAYFAIDDYDFEAAKRWVEQAIAVNPRSREAHSYLAATKYLLEDRKGYEETCKKVLALDPNYGEIYHIVANLVALLRRYEEAHAICEKAVEVDPKNWSAMTSLGKYCFNTGRGDAGLKYLRTAQNNDPSRYAWRLNMIEVSRFYQQFVKIENPRFELKLHVDETPVMKNYLLGMLESAYTTLTEKYRFEPANPTVVEMFPEQGDFAVRTVGFEGIQGVLGACFGRVMTLNSPKALPPGSFVWARTVWHEFAHVVTLQLSKYRVPRWLTEGLSVYEEASARTEWARDHDFDLVNAYANDKIMRILDLNAAFRSPRIIMAYYQSGLLCQYLADNYGFSTLVDMLKKYGEGLSTEQVFEAVYKRTVEEIDADFLAHVESIVNEFEVQPLYDRDRLEEYRLRTQEDPKDLEATILLAAAYLQMGKVIDFGHYLAKAEKLGSDDPRIDYWKAEERFRRGRFEDAEKLFKRAESKGVAEFFLHQRLGLIAGELKRSDEAIARFELAKAAFPTYLGSLNPYTELAKLYSARGEDKLAMAELKSFVDLVQEDYPNRIVLARYLMGEGEHRQAWEYLQQAIYINPYEFEVHEIAGDCLRILGEYNRAILELEVARDLTEKTEVKISVLKKLAQVYLEAKRPEQARFELQEVLRLAPEDEETLQMLETIGE